MGPALVKPEIDIGAALALLLGPAAWALCASGRCGSGVAHGCIARRCLRPGTIKAAGHTPLPAPILGMLTGVIV